MKPFLSVLICTYNRLELLKQALQSVLEQDFKDLEIIISDDHSNDGTKEFINALAKHQPQLRYSLNTNYKQGPNGNKNNALDQARGEYILFLDDDDMLLNGALSTLVSKIKEGFSHVFGNCLLEKDGILSTEFSGKGLNKDCEVSKKDFLLGRMNGEFLGMFKKSLLKNQRFDENFWGNESVLWVSLYKEKSFYIHKALRIYRIKRADSVTNKAFLKANRVYLGYAKMAELLECELKKSKDRDYKGVTAAHYKMAAYYAKMAGLYKKMYIYLFKSLSIKPNFPALALLCLSFIPKAMLQYFSKIRVSLKCKN